MKIKEGYMLRKIVDSWVVVPIGERVVEFNGLISLNDSSAVLWEKLEGGAEFDELVDVILNEYEIDKETAQSDVREFLDSLIESGVIG